MSDDTINLFGFPAVGIFGASLRSGYALPATPKTAHRNDNRQTPHLSSGETCPDKASQLTR
jgi:hypothetical protein